MFWSGVCLLFYSLALYILLLELFSHTLFMPNGALNSLRTFVMLAQNGYLFFIWKNGQFSFQSQRRAMPKNSSNYHTISHASKVMAKILQARLQQYKNRELIDVQAGFRKCRGTRDQIANIRWIIEKWESSRKTFTSALLTMPNLWLCGSQWTVENS